MRLGKLKRMTNVFSQLVYAKVSKKRMPIRVGLQLTKFCNMRCTYCYVDWEEYKTAESWTQKELFDLIDLLHRKGMRWLWFLGGEPMLRKDFREIITYAQNKGIYCDMNTNGTMINDKNIDICKMLDAVCISLDGDEESNDFYRGKGNYKKAVDAAAYLIKNGVDVRLHSILTQKTYSKLDHMVKLSQDLGTSFNFCEVLKHEKQGDHILTPEQEEEFYGKYIEYKKKGYPIVYSVEGIESSRDFPKVKKNEEDRNDRIWRTEAKEYKGKFTPCSSGDLLCFYDITGQVYACNGTWNDGRNAKEIGWDAAWDHLKNKKCVGCKCMGETDLHKMFTLKPKSVWNVITQLITPPEARVME